MTLWGYLMELLMTIRDPCNFYSLCSFAWNVILQVTGIRLEMLTDIEQHMFVDPGVRKGVAIVPKPHVVANHPLSPGLHDALRPTSYIL